MQRRAPQHDHRCPCPVAVLQDHLRRPGVALPQFLPRCLLRGTIRDHLETIGLDEEDRARAYAVVAERLPGYRSILLVAP